MSRASICILLVLVLLSLAYFPTTVEGAKWGGWKPTKKGAGGGGGGPGAGAGGGPEFGGPEERRGGGGGGGPRGGEDDRDQRRGGRPSKPPKESDEYDFDKMGPPGQNGGQKPKIDKCLKQALRFCSLNDMEKDFSGFIKCIAGASEKVRSDCTEWAANHGPCAEEIGVLCAKKSPPDTTECIMKNRDDFGETCKKSAFFTSLVEGYEQYKRNSEKEGGKPKDSQYHTKSHKDFENHEEIEGAPAGAGRSASKSRSSRGDL